jgi:hypothetical protein
LIFHTVWNWTIADCTFAHLGAAAVQIDEGSQSVAVTGSTFADVSCGGVLVGQVNDTNTTDPNRMNAHVLVDGNTFSFIPVEYRDCAPLVGGYLVNATFSHNAILNCTNTGISLGWGWSRDEATNAGSNTIAGNYVFGSNQLLVDGGSIYVLGPQPNSSMTRNYVRAQAHLYGALYTDEGSAYWDITYNVVDSVPEWLHIWTPSIHDETVAFCWTNSNYSDVHGTRITIENITYLPAGVPFPPDAQAIIDASGPPSMAGPKL